MKGWPWTVFSALISRSMRTSLSWERQIHHDQRASALTLTYDTLPKRLAVGTFPQMLRLFQHLVVV